ncbi:MAG: large-conductance mechanosensitive channel protein MscL [Ruminococcaceae bacterium]|jgi:large conductance mechanosensitive channel|nr:large-conductance mechanosensitive channel protein MscL [Oscillospiraceae bacterium]
MWEEFKKFAFKGNVMDMAVGVIIGGAFGKIITSLVNDMLMPIIGIFLGKVNFADLKVVLSPAELDAAGEVVKAESAIAYGAFIQSIVDFLLVALCIFFMVKAINNMHKKEEPAPAPEEPKGPTTEELLTEIRDLMKK